MFNGGKNKMEFLKSLIVGAGLVGLLAGCQDTKVEDYVRIACDNTNTSFENAKKHIEWEKEDSITCFHEAMDNDGIVKINIYSKGNKLMPFSRFRFSKHIGNISGARIMRREYYDTGLHTVKIEAIDTKGNILTDEASFLYK